MSKDKISDYSATANSNTDIAGINIDEGCAPSGINNAIRTLMKQLKDWQSGSQDVYITPAGSAAAPAVTTTGDTNTGILFPAADTVAVSTGGTERVRVDSAGNMGLAVTPSAWRSICKVTQMGFGSAFYGLSDRNYSVMATNRYSNSSGGDIYINNGYALSYEQNNSGAHLWNIAASGTAGNPITFTQAMTLDASGYLGIGTSSPGQRLDLAGGSMTLSASTGTQQIYLYRFSSTNYSSIGTDSSAGGITFTTGTSSPAERMRIDSSGNVGIGETSPAVAGYAKSIVLNAGTGSGNYAQYRMKSTNGGDFSWYSLGSSSVIGSIGMDSSSGTNPIMLFGIGGSERVRIDSSGNLLVGTTSADARLTAYGTTSDSTAYTVAFKNSTGGLSLLVRNDGYVRSSTTYSNTNAAAANVYIDSGGYLYRSTSSLKYKTDVSDAEHGLVDLLKLRSVTYKQKTPNADGSEQKQIFGGLIAEEVHEAGLTEFVQYADDGTPDALAYGQMVSLCIKAIQEQQAIIEQLKADVAALKGQA